MNRPLLTVRITHEHDVVSARQRARELAEGFGFEAVEQTRIATAVSEIARNAFVYARGGHVDFMLEGSTPPQLFAVRVRDEGGGIANLDEVLHGRYRSRTGMGLGMIGSKRLVDRFDVQTGASTSPAGITATAVPEPASLLFLATGLVGFGARRWRQGRTRQ